jgi:hypothetical protein
MARVPALLLKREDYGEVKDAWMDRLLRPLNTFGKQVQDALNKGLTFGDNSLAFVKTITAVYPFPGVGAQGQVKMRNDLPSGKPLGVLTISAQDLGPSGAPTPPAPVSAPNPAWSISGDQIYVTDVAGLTSGHKYQITFLVVGG